MTSRQEALDIVHEFVKNEALVRHMLAVETAMRHYAGLYGEDVETWGLAGLLRGQPDIEIVGVVEDSLYEGPREGVRRQVFIPNWGRNSATFYVRTTGASGSTYNLIRGAVAALDNGLPIYEMKTLQGQLDETLMTERLIALLSAGFGLLATVLASIGLYGVMAFVVTRRSKEMGIRLALGAEPGTVVWLVMKEVLVLLGIGLVIGVPAAMALGPYVASQLYGLEPGDPGIALSTVALLGVVSILAGFLPARRAGRINPVATLRYE